MQNYPACKTLNRYSQTYVKRQLKKAKTKILMTNGSLMTVKSIAECSPSAFILTCIKRLVVLKTNFGLFESGRFTQVLLNASVH